MTVLRSIVPPIYIDTITISAAVELFLQAKEDEGRRSGTLISYRRTTRNLVTYIGEDILLLSIEPQLLRSYFGELRKSHNVGGVAHIHRNIKAFFKWFWLEYDVMIRNPIDKVKVEQPQIKPRRGIPLESIERLLRACTTENRLRDRAIILGLLDTCARASEFCALNVEDIDLNTGIATIQEGKGGKLRRVRFGSKSLRALRKYLKTRQNLHYSDPLFATDEGDQLVRRTLHRIIQRRIQAAKIKQWGLHDFRRRGLYEMWVKTRDIKGVSLYAGHSNVTVTQRYLAINDEDILSMHRIGSPVDQLKI